MKRAWIGALLLAACGTSHAPAGDGSTGSCSGSPPGPCALPGPEIGCCERVDATCRDGEWECPDPSLMGWACETYSCGSTGSCSGREPTCRTNLGEGCCGDVFAASCGPSGSWSCGFGGMEEELCTSFAPVCGSTGSCDDLGWIECLAAPGCTAIYDDSCCPICDPGGPCADCTRPFFHHCSTEGAACADDPPAQCGFPAPWICPRGTPSCSTANPVDDIVCDVPGCIARVPAPCAASPPSGGCPPACVPVHGGICNALCDILAPDCGSRVPEVEDGCYTSSCIGASICAG